MLKVIFYETKLKLLGYSSWFYLSFGFVRFLVDLFE